MTLIAGFKSSDGYVLCADSQETVEIGTKRKKEEYRVTSQKITPERFGNFDLAIAGAGDGDVIEAFIQRLRDNMLGMQITSLIALKEYLQHEIRDFQNTETGGYSKSEKRFSLLIGAHSCDDNSCALWRSRIARLTSINGCALIGFEDARYIDAMESLYPKDGSATTAQCIFLGLYLLWLAANTSNYIRDPISVVLVRPGGLIPQEPAIIAKLQQRVVLFHAQFDKVFLSCADTGLQPGQFATKVREFIETIISLRRDYVAESVGQMMEEGLDKLNEAYTLIPTGTEVFLDAGNAEHIRIQTEIAKALRANESGEQDLSRIVANLTAIKSVQEKLLAKFDGGTEDPSKAELSEGARALSEVHAAVGMGTFKVDQSIVNLLDRALHYLRTDLLFGERVNLQLRIAAIEQASQFVQKATPSTPQT